MKWSQFNWDVDEEKGAEWIVKCETETDREGKSSLMAAGEVVQGANNLFLVFVLWSWVILSPSTEESLCEIDPAMPLAHEDTTA